MEKLIKDENVAVLISHGWGAGFYSWGAPLPAIFDPNLIDLILAENYQEAVNYVEKVYPGTYTGGIEDLNVIWIPQGTEFMITEYDGNESVMFKEDEPWITA